MARVRIPWKESFRSGFSSIDDQHRHLIAVINEFLDRLAAECPIEDIHYYLSEIHDLIDTHFKEEEVLVRVRRYGEFAAHKADHDRLLRQIHDIRKTVIEEDEAIRKSNLAKALDAWFSIHFRTYDKALHQ